MLAFCRRKFRGGKKFGSSFLVLEACVMTQDTMLKGTAV